MRYALYTSAILALLAMAFTGAWSQAYTTAELDQLLGPIALYPDPLLAQVLPAATFPDQLKAANDLVQSGGSATIDSQPWDVSVKSIAHYPDVLAMMATNADWTAALGQAYVNQPGDVMTTIQRLRDKAKLQGYLSSNSQQIVSDTGGYISIVPAQPQYIFVPTYDPAIVYTQPYSYSQAALYFGAGLLIGAWLNNAINWNNHRVYYHGWQGGGWIGRSRSFVNVNNRTFVNNSWRNRSAPVNRDIRNRNTTDFRRDLGRNRGSFAPPGLVRPGTPTTRPGVPTTRPGEPTVRPTPTPGIPGAGPGTRPGVRPGTPTTRPGMPATRPNVPTTRPGVPTTRPAPTPGSPGMGPGTRPGVRPGVPTTRPSIPTTRPSAPTVRPNVPTTRPSVTPGGRGPRPVTPSAPRTPTVRPSTRPSGGGAGRAPSSRPSGTRSAPSGSRSGEGGRSQR